MSQSKPHTRSDSSNWSMVNAAPVGVVVVGLVADDIVVVDDDDGDDTNGDGVVDG